MPELPEVETVVRQLRTKIVNKNIIDLKILDKKVIDENIIKILPSKIINIQRRGKSIIIKLNNNNNLLIQLRMTGHFYHTKDLEETKKYLAGILKLNDNSYLTYNTIRRFGRVQLFNNKQLKNKFSKLGPEPLEISKDQFTQIMQEYPNANIKNKLLDQNTIVGIGNIYAQEVLYYSKIHPQSQIKDISQNKLNILYKEIQRILKLAIKNNGTTVNNFSHLDGKGDFQNFLAVYNQKTCPNNHEIEKINIGSRGTSYCPKCQNGN